jgi:hypothetical protein
MYKEHPEMYRKVEGDVYLIRHGTVDQPKFEWILPKHLDRAKDAEIMAKLLLVELADPDDPDIGVVISREDYHKNPDKWVVIDIYVVVVRNEFPYRIENIPVNTYQAFINEYELLSTAYVVVPRNPEVEL